MDKENGKSISRRDFFKIAGAAGMVTAGLVGCNEQSKSSFNVIGEPDGDMTYRILTGDRVSLLSYGCMRWPMISNPDGEGQIVDQEEVNRLVDYALAHGINYFDTAPPYCQGLSEEALHSVGTPVIRISLPRKCPITVFMELDFAVKNYKRQA